MAGRTSKETHEAVRLYVEEGYTRHAAAKKAGIGANTMYLHCKRHKIKPKKNKALAKKN